MLDRGHAHPAAHPVGRQPDQRQCARRDKQAYLCQGPHVAFEQVERIRQHQHDREIGADHQQRERTESERTRRPELEARGVRIVADGEGYRDDRRGKPLDRDQFGRRPSGEIGQRMEVERERPHPRHCRGIPAQQAARGQGSAHVEVMDQDQRTDRSQDAQDRGGFEHHQACIGPTGITPGQHQQRDLEYLDDCQCNRCGSHKAQALVAAIIGEQTEEDENPGKVARHFRERNDQSVGREAGRRKAPVCRQGERCHAGPTVWPFARTETRDPQRGQAANQCADRVKHGPEAADPIHHRAPSGQRMTRAVWRRISTSRKGE